MVADILGNFKNKYKVKGTVSDGLVCDQCQEGELLTQSHCMTCSAWSDLRDGLDMTNTTDLPKFFRKLLAEQDRIA